MKTINKINTIIAIVALFNLTSCNKSEDEKQIMDTNPVTKESENFKGTWSISPSQNTSAVFTISLNSKNEFTIENAKINGVSVQGSISNVQYPMIDQINLNNGEIVLTTMTILDGFDQMFVAYTYYKDGNDMKNQDNLTIERVK